MSDRQTKADLTRLRLAATLAHVVPGVHLIDVERADAVQPCHLRAAVAHALRHDLVVDHIPVVDLVVEEGHLHPSGIVRAPLHDREVHVFATTLPTTTCASLLAERGSADDVVHLWHDDATDVTLVHVENPPCRRGRDAAMDVLVDALAACVAEELIS